MDQQVLGTLSISVAYLIRNSEDKLQKSDIIKFIELYRKTQLNHENIGMKCHSATFLAETLPHLIPDDVIDILEDVINNLLPANCQQSAAHPPPAAHRFAHNSAGAQSESANFQQPLLPMA